MAGPGMLGLVPDSESVRTLAEVGVVFLLFEIGLELPLDRLRRLWRSALVVGGTQVGLTIGIVAGVSMLFGMSGGTALILGGVVAMSSTALVMKLLSDSGQVDSPHGQLTVSILILQDLSIVPLLLCIPLLGAAGAPDDGGWAAQILPIFGRQLLALALVFAIVRYLVPRILARAAHTGSSDLFSILALLVVLGSAFFAEEVGLTLAVGAFLAGVAASGSPFAHQLFSEVVPLRGVLLGVFFTAVGMLFDPRVLIESPLFVLAYLAAAVLLKAAIVAAAAMFLLRQSGRIAVLAAISLAQTGEFSFVLLEAAHRAGLIDGTVHQGVLAGSILSLMATPLLLRIAPGIADRVDALRPAAVARSSPSDDDPDVPLSVATPTDSPGPVILVGFGPAGQTLARLLRSLDIPYVVIEANALGVERARERGEPILYGDATRPELMRRLGVENARLVAIAISDPLATRRIVSRVHTLAPSTPILARTRYVREVDPLESAGAVAVVADEFESSIGLVTRALQLFEIPDSSILKFTEALREGGYMAIRADLGLSIDPWLVELLDEVDVQWEEVPSAFPADRSLAALDIRGSSGANILAVRRGGETTSNPPPSFELKGGDQLLVLGDAAILAELRELLAKQLP